VFQGLSIEIPIPFDSLGDLFLGDLPALSIPARLEVAIKLGQQIQRREERGSSQKRVQESVAADKVYIGSKLSIHLGLPGKLQCEL
jgi:hypothetical protein